MAKWTVRFFVSKMSTCSSVSCAGCTPATDKPWCLTLNAESKEVFVWKHGVRLKLKDGSSSGPVTGASVLNTKDKTVTVSDVTN